MKFAKSIVVRTSVVALALAAVPVASSAMQQPAPAPVMASDPAAFAVGVQAPPSVADIAQAQLVTEAAALNPGQFVFRPELSPTGNVEIVVSIPQQRAYVYRANRLIGVSTVSTGMSGHRTPTGRYPIMEKRRTHFSNLYNNAPMPFMQRLTMGGIALHAGQIPGYPASHGCVRFPYEMARNVFSVTQVRSVVHIVNHSPTPETALQIARGERPAMPMEEAVRGTR